MKGSFQLILIILFIAAAIFGVLVFSGAIPIGGDDNKAVGNVVLWGTIRAADMGLVLEEFNNINKTFSVSYVEKSPDTFDQDLLESLASGVGPDLFFLPDNLAFHYSNKLFTIPYQSYSLSTFKQTFAGAGEVFLTSKGIMAFPMTIDPLVMYYNRSMLDSSGVAHPPALWDEVSSLVPVINKKDDSNKIIKSTVSMGHFSNIPHAKDILATLFMQAGSPIINEQDGFFHSALSSSNVKYDLGSLLEFYTDFADPAKDTYTWNKSFSNSVNAFSSEDVALYLGYASELKYLSNRNPNQNFLAAPVPQLRGESSKVTSAHVLGLAISSFSKNFDTAFIAASLMATGDFAAKLSATLGVPPARRDLLAAKPIDAYNPIFYSSALYAKSYLDPSSANTNDIFRTMIDGVLSNTRTPSDAVRDASAKLDLLLLR